MPVYGIKWCCILLNEFLPAAAARRAFSVGKIKSTARKVRQLQKSRELFSTLAAN